MSILSRSIQLPVAQPPASPPGPQQLWKHRQPPKPAQTHSWKETWLSGNKARLGTRKKNIKRTFSLAVVLHRGTFAPRGHFEALEDIFDCYN